MKTELPYHHFFFVGIGGTGMSAIAQFLRGRGKKVSGSDRLFAQKEKTLIQAQLEAMGIDCHHQDASGITEEVDVLVISTAIEESNVELQKAKKLNIPVIKRSALLARISDSMKTIAVGGTSGKSTTTAMTFHILQKCGCDPSLITGAGLVSLQKKNLPGNAYNGKSDWLVIESDESDGSIVGYHPQIAALLNVGRDHKELDVLMDLFGQFKAHTTGAFIVNLCDAQAAQLCSHKQQAFGIDNNEAGFNGTHFEQKGYNIQFDCNGVHFSLPQIGEHNMSNALAATAICVAAGLTLQQCADALASYEGIYRRTQLVGKANNCYVIDDFAHNPSEVVCAIRSCQNFSHRVFAWFQPHGFGPLRFMHTELETEVVAALRPEDYFVLSDVYYAGGTVERTITAQDVANTLQQKSKQVLYFANRKDFIPYLQQNLQDGDTIIIMGARDTTLSDYAQEVYQKVMVD